MAVQAPVRSRTLPGNWRHALRTCGPPPDPDPVSKWLVIARACVLPMTLVAAAVAGLLAVRRDSFEPLYFALSLIGVVLAHSSNNMINDYFDLRSGLDTSSYPRALYAPHPVLSGLTTKQQLLVAIAATNAADAAIMLGLVAARGWPVAAFALAGLFVSVFYVAPPLRLKARGLGEVGVFLVWGPLMVGGTYYAAAGDVTWEVVAASVPYGLLVMSVLMGKHIDKAPWDREAGVRTLPVALGDRRARRATLALMSAFYLGVLALVGAGIFTMWTLVVAGALPLFVRAGRTYARPKPETPPDNYPVWPLWFASWAFVHSRRAGGLLVLGLAAGALWPAYL
jgi:1,4-dihydroxy-2-naphthoate polyprenyltransferase